MKLKYTYIALGLLIGLFLQESSITAGNTGDGDPSVARIYAAHSVLSSGDWYKIAVGNSGIYRIRYTDLQAMGINMASLDPRNIRIYGNGGGMLPESNSTARPDDLKENAILVSGESDGVFNESDYILFYAKGPVSWRYNATQKIWEHIPNIYSDSAYYYLTPGQGRGKRLNTYSGSALPSTAEVNSYDFMTWYDKDAINLIKSGRSWFGEVFDINLSNTFSFDCPGLIAGSVVSIRTVTAARATSSSSFTGIAGVSSWQIPHSPISTYYNSPYASGTTSYQKLEAASSPVSITLRYNKSTTTAIGWLDCIDLTARCNLDFQGGQLSFRDVASVGSEKVSAFRLSRGAGKAAVWDITDPVNPAVIDATVSGSDLVFNLQTDSLREFIAFDLTNLYVPRFVSKIGNQDLHGLSGIDMVIVAPALFYNQAARLAAFHMQADDLNTVVLTPEMIYNEFSSGSQDVIAIRDFMKMLYDRGDPNRQPKYLLLFGDGSYDNKNRLTANTNFIPTWQTSESFDPVSSGVSDDYFGLLDDGEGTSYSDKIDLGIGRLPVSTEEEAEAMVDKIIHYSEKSAATMGDWRSIVAFIADDEDGNEHISQADNMATYIESNFDAFNIDKIYMDAYIQQTTTAGARYPEVNKAITQRVEKGCLFLNYTGHGGETGLAHEQVVEVQDINGWSNYDNLPVFVTATCEFSRFDDPSRTSAGELVFLNPLGGGIALFTTTRPTYGSPNFGLNKSLYKYAFTRSGEGKPRFGDVMREAKRESGSNENGRKFILLGDPAQAIAFPDLKISTLSINGKPTGENSDTLKAYDEVTVTGRITDASGRPVEDFNGMVYPTVFDKAVDQMTLGNDDGTPFAFTLRKSILYKGKVQAAGGAFNFTFIVPRDIAYRFDYGKISYYASDGTRDAAGSYSNIVIGGSSGSASSDETGPDIALYMNDDRFTDGGITDENPWLYALVNDQHGINTVGSGIGHDITAILDGKTDEPYILNDYYEADVNTFNSGRIRFPFSLLSEGDHTVTLKVWDIYNNSSEATTRFTVKASDQLVIRHPSNYPNPFNGYTDLVFEHNQQGSELEVTASIYTISGQLVATLSQTGLESGTLSTPLRWNGRNSNGAMLPPGFYLYTLMARTTDGDTARVNGKMILTKQ